MYTHTGGLDSAVVRLQALQQRLCCNAKIHDLLMVVVHNVVLDRHTRRVG